MTAFTESIVEEAALAWLESVGWSVTNGAAIAPGEPGAERDDYGQVVLAQRLRDALARLNPALPAEALDDAFRKLTRPEGAELVAQNRALHRLLVDGVTVEYRTAEGEIRGAQAQVIDFDQPSANDWLAVNQFSVTENEHARRPDLTTAIATSCRDSSERGGEAMTGNRAADRAAAARFARWRNTAMTVFTESVVEQAALAWFESMGWSVRNGAEIAAMPPAAEGIT